MELRFRKGASVDNRRSLLSRLSDLSDSYKRNVSSRQERHPSPLPSRVIKDTELYIPLRPSQKPNINRLSSPEPLTFATKYAFSTIGIPPLTQNTKHGVVKITKDGNVELSLPSISRSTFTISSDSAKIIVRNGSKVIWDGDADDLPWRWTRVYRYASRFVGICRARIPEVSVEVNGLRGRIMLNGDFEAVDMVEATMVRMGTDRRSAKVFTLNENVEKLQWQGNNDEIPGVWKSLLRSATTVYQKCLTVSGEQFESEDGTAICVTGVGWCSVRGKRIQVLFDDAVRIEVDLDEREVMYCDARRRKERWQLNHDHLPSYIRERLDRCRAFRDVE